MICDLQIRFRGRIHNRPVSLGALAHPSTADGIVRAEAFTEAGLVRIGSYCFIRAHSSNSDLTGTTSGFAPVSILVSSEVAIRVSTTGRGNHNELSVALHRLLQAVPEWSIKGYGLSVSFRCSRNIESIRILKIILLILIVLSVHADVKNGVHECVNHVEEWVVGGTGQGVQMTSDGNMQTAMSVFEYLAIRSVEIRVETVSGYEIIEFSVVNQGTLGVSSARSRQHCSETGCPAICWVDLSILERSITYYTVTVTKQLCCVDAGITVGWQQRIRSRIIDWYHHIRLLLT